MEKNVKKKLNLSKETLRYLNKGTLSEVVGGASLFCEISCVDSCIPRETF